MSDRYIIPVVGSGGQNGMPNMRKGVNHMVLKWGELGRPQAGSIIIAIFMTLANFNKSNYNTDLMSTCKVTGNIS